MNSVMDIALSLAASGLPVFSCGTNKAPCIPEKEGGHGFKDASTDPDEVRRLFRHPGARLVGVPTGEKSGFDVLDFDYVHGAGAWEAAHRSEIPETRTHETMSGGRHLLFRYAHGVARNSASRIGPGMDVRGAGGYIIHPPSTGYRVISDAPIVHWPDWLLVPGLVLPPLPEELPQAPQGPYKPASSEQLQKFIDRVLHHVRSTAEGQKHWTLRNQSLLLGGVQAEAGFTDNEAVRWLLDALPRTIKDRKNAEKTARWGLEIGRTMPIELPAPVPREHVKALTRIAFRLVRGNYPANEAWALMQGEAARLGVSVDHAHRIAQWVVAQHDQRNGGKSHV
jgi:hypothetical protein